MKKSKDVGLKVLFMGIIVIVLLCLNTCIGRKVNDRRYNYNTAVGSISSAAGGSMFIKDIYICVPYERITRSTSYNGEVIENRTPDEVFYDAKKISYDATINSQRRTLGIYSSPIFTGDLSINGEFDFTVPKSDSFREYKFDQAYLKLVLNDRTIVSQPVFELNGQPYETSYLSGDKNGSLIAKFNCDTGNIKFSTKLSFRGAEKFYVHLASTDTSLKINCDWNSPCFSNYDYLPVTHSVTEDGFTAEWSIPFDSGDRHHEIGFDYLEPVNLYKMLNRATDYGFLFIIVPFIVLFLFEIFASINLHPFNYLLCGAASITFFLLLLSFSEHINFLASYLIAAVASGVLISLYVASITRKIKLGFSMSLVFILMYGYLFFSLKSEDYALLIGSLFIFIVLALVMFFTRKVNWNEIKKNKEEITVKE